jgi:SAM-dependent methyltransferase
LERREKLVSGLDLQHLVGIEIGPLDRPVITKQDGRIIYIDHTDTASLKGKYENDPNVNVEAIANVDAIWGAQTLQEAIGPDVKVDYVVASHVIEHVPDLITWLEELCAVLKPGGEVRLAVPDRRFTFDHLRRETTLADILSARLARARIPSPTAILDFLLNATTVSHVDAWERKLNPSALKPTHTVDQAMSVARDSLENGNYHDVHCWVFTPRSFADLFAKAGEAGLIRFACSAFHDTAQYHIEFFAALRVCDDRAEVAGSWRNMGEIVACTELEAQSTSERDLAAVELKGSLANIESQLDRLEVSAAEQAALLQRLDGRNAAELDNLQRKLDALYDSTSWRLTGPLRAAIDAVRRHRGP